jgi:murein L,D-transpeptidase YcbB/YkuD
MKLLFRLIIFIVTAAFFSHLSAAGYDWGGSKNNNFFDDASAKIESRVSGDKLPVLDKLYKELYYAPLWVKNRGLSPYGKSLLSIISADETVTPSVKFYKEIGQVHTMIDALVDKKGGSMANKVALELAMSKLYSHYARYRIYGGINWAPFKHKLNELTKDYKIRVGWVKYAPPLTPADVLGRALSEGDLKNAFEEADPTRFQYGRLKKYLIRYIDIAKHGGWPRLPRSGTLKPGKTNAKTVPLIRKHLSMTGDLQGCAEPMNSPKYDPCLVKAVKKFQLRHGLKGNGVIGKATRRALNQTVTDAIQKIRLNLDRIKWLSREKKPERIELNIPSFRLNFFAGNKLVTTIRVVTGRPNHPTPIFHNKMKYIVVNPWWKIPESIVRHEMLPRLIKDPYHYEAQGKELHESWDESSPRIDPGTVNWSKYRGNNKPIPYHFMQVPSRHNALGKIKFLFPNGYQVYIHDTPSKSLFFRNVRAFSHGCMRIQKPRELLESLALFNSNIDVDAVMKQLEGTQKETISLNHSVPIDITYLTAFVDPYGYLNFRKDIYHYDKYQLKDYATKCVSLSGFKPRRIVPARQTPPQTNTPEQTKPNTHKIGKTPSTQKDNPVKIAHVTTSTKHAADHKQISEKKPTTTTPAYRQKPIAKNEGLKKKLPSRAVRPIVPKPSTSRTKTKTDPDGYNIIELYDN